MNSNEFNNTASCSYKTEQMDNLNDSDFDLEAILNKYKDEKEENCIQIKDTSSDTDSEPVIDVKLDLSSSDDNQQPVDMVPFKKFMDNWSSDENIQLVQDNERKPIRKRKTIPAYRIRAQEGKLKSKVDRLNKKEQQPDELLKNVIVVIDKEIYNEYTNEIVKRLQSKQIKHNVENQLIPRTITWMRHTNTHYVDAEKGNTIQSVTTKEEIKQTLLIINNNELLNLIKNKTLLSHVKNIQLSSEGKRVSCLIYGLDKYLKQWKLNHLKYPNDYPVSKKEINDNLLDLQLFCNCYYKIISNCNEFAHFLFQFTRSVTLQMFKEQKRKEESEWDVDFDIAGDNKGTVSVTKDGIGLDRLWKEQLLLIPSANLGIVEAVLSEYPTPNSLYVAYKHLSANEGKRLLQDIDIRRKGDPTAVSKRIGPEFSRRLFNLFMNIEPDEEL